MNAKRADRIAVASLADLMEPEKLGTARARAHVTLRDVANAAGVSPMSVSNFINARHGQMRPETRARIQARSSALAIARTWRRAICVYRGGCRSTW